MDLQEEFPIMLLYPHSPSPPILDYNSSIFRFKAEEFCQILQILINCKCIIGTFLANRGIEFLNYQKEIYRDFQIQQQQHFAMLFSTTTPSTKSISQFVGLCKRIRGSMLFRYLNTKKYRDFLKIQFITLVKAFNDDYTDMPQLIPQNVRIDYPEITMQTILHYIDRCPPFFRDLLNDRFSTFIVNQAYLYLTRSISINDHIEHVDLFKIMHYIERDLFFYESILDIEVSGYLERQLITFRMR